MRFWFLPSSGHLILPLYFLMQHRCTVGGWAAMGIGWQPLQITEGPGCWDILWLMITAISNQDSRVQKGVPMYLMRGRVCYERTSQPIWPCCLSLLGQRTLLTLSSSSPSSLWVVEWVVITLNCIQSLLDILDSGLNTLLMQSLFKKKTGARENNICFH